MADRKSTGRDPEKLKAKRRRYYLKHRGKALAYQSARRKPFSEWTPQEREQGRLAKIKARRRSGIQPKQPAQVPCQWEANARQAWSWWLKTCPDWWMRAYYRAQGKPWNNPRVSKADQWRIRYWCDPVFRASQIEKVQTLKIRRAERIAANNDGTLTGEVIVSLFAAATHCAYCTSVMRSVQKSLDHVVALSKGGAHSVTNVVVCCKTCNSKKGARALTQSVSAQLIHGCASAEKV